MPSVKTKKGMKKFPYTKDGIAEAKAFAKWAKGKMMKARKNKMK